MAPLNRLVELLPLLFRGLYRGQLISGEPFEVGFDLIAMHHVDIFMMEVEQIDFVNQFRAVACALLNDWYVKSIRIGVHLAPRASNLLFLLIGMPAPAAQTGE